MEENLFKIGFLPLFIALIAIVWVPGCKVPEKVEKAGRSTAVPKDPKQREVRVIHRSVAAMGTLFDITVALDKESIDASPATRAAFDEIQRVDNLMTAFRLDSHISKVNARAGSAATRVPKELVDLVIQAKKISKLTHGKFDISFAAMGGLWDFKLKKPTLPDPAEIKRRLSLIDYNSIITDEKKSTIRLEKIGMRIGLGAIAKGYAVDRAGEVLRKHGFENFIIYGGGDLLVSGSKGGRPWSVGVQDPRIKSRYFARVNLSEGGAVVTSGDYEKFFYIEGKRYHHIIDPDTGFPALGLASVTVLADTATRADALATGLFVLGLEKSMNLIESTPNLEGIIVDDKLNAWVSSGIKSRVELSPIGEAEKGAP